MEVFEFRLAIFGSSDEVMRKDAGEDAAALFVPQTKAINPKACLQATQAQPNY